MVRATRDIIKGEEVCISYVPVKESFENRKMRLSAWKIICTCPRCEDESTSDPYFHVPCKCSVGYFTAQSGAPDQQVCACGEKFDRVACENRLSEMQKANIYMKSREASMADPRKLVEMLNPLAPGLNDPPRHVECLSLLNNLSNSHYFVGSRMSGPHQEASIRNFLKYKEQYMASFDLTEKWTNHKDLNYFRSLHRILMCDFPSHAMKRKWTKRKIEACLLLFGQPDIPAGILEDVLK